MAKTLAEYVAWLDERKDLLWAQAPPIQPLKATPSIKPLADIRVITLNPYGTLLHVDHGQLFHLHPQQLRTQIALEKTIKEFNMWNSMSRKPGQPWEYMLQQYTKLLEERQMSGTKRKGDTPAIDSSKIWLKILERLEKNEYVYDSVTLGDLEALSVKVAYFFHASMQGVAASPHACEILTTIILSGRHVGLLGDGQPFTLVQILRALKQQAAVHSLNEVLSSDSVFLSSDWGVRQPSPSLYEQARERFAAQGIQPHEVLHVSHQLKDDLGPARKVGFRTALYAADKTACQVSREELQDPELRPDRLLTEFRQLRDLLML